MLALDPGALRSLLDASPQAAATAPELARRAAACVVAPPFAVTRLWLDRDVGPSRPTFNAVSREPTLDSITVYSLVGTARRAHAPAGRW